MIPYILHVSVLLAIFYIFYWLLLKKETFYRLNRWVLIGGLALSLTLPLVHVPPSMSLHASPIAETSNEFLPPSSIGDVSGLAWVKEKTKTSEEPVPRQELAELYPEQEQTIENSWGAILHNLDWMKIMKWGYWAGVGIFSITFFIQFLVIIFSRINLGFIQDGKFRIYEMSKDTPPFSFLNWIFINPTLYNPEAYDQILEHEKIHVEQAHSIDKLLVEFIIIMNWFNPFAWMLRKAINNNIEFLTDEEMLKKGTEKKSYQMNLLRISVPQHALSITTNYNESFLKERIGMMNSKKSSARSSWKYLMVFPIVFISLMTLNAVQLPEQNVEEPKVQMPLEKEKQNEKNNKEEKRNQEAITKKEEANSFLNESPSEVKNESITTITTTTTTTSDEINPTEDGLPETEIENVEFHTTANEEDIQDIIDDAMGDFDPVKLEKDMNEMMDDLEQKLNIELPPVVVDPNSKKSCAPKKGCTPSSKKSCDPKKNSNKKDCGTNSIYVNEAGSWKGRVEGNEVCFYMNKSKKGKYDWQITECYPLSQLGSLPRNRQDEIRVEKDPGTLIFTGSFKGDEGAGTFDFKENNSFISFLKKQGIGSINIDELFLMFLNNTSREFITGLKKRGFDPDVEDVLEFGVHDISLNYIDKIQEMGFKNISKNKIIEFAIHGVEPTEAKRIKNIFPDISSSKLVEFNIHGVTASYIEKLKKLGYGSDELSASKIVEFAIHGVSINYLTNLKELGYGPDVMSGSKLVEFAIHGINSNYIQNLTNLGYGADVLSPSKLVEFGVHGIMSKYVKALQDAGFKNLSSSKIVEAHIHGVSANEISKMKYLGISGNTSMSDFVAAKIHGVTTQFIKEAQRKGVKSSKLSDYIDVKIHGVY